MRSKIMFYLGLAVFSMLVNITVFGADISYQDLVQSAKDNFAYQVSNIKSIEYKVVVSDIDAETILYIDVWAKSPGRVKVKRLDVRPEASDDGEFIFDKGKSWSNSSMVPVEMYMGMVEQALSGDLRGGAVLEEESGLREVSGTTYAVATLLFFGKCKVKAYYKIPDSRRPDKYEVFLLQGDNWNKLMDLKPQDYQEVEGSVFPRRTVQTLYEPEGQEERVMEFYKIKVNQEIDDSIFQIPQ
ncbi:MAG: hypothetical protein K9L86_00385 [Candidatus Omnitrophica bacterium]|nr:hypothetical protein [Candidatus Omnitrophota bacterium]